MPVGIARAVRSGLEALTVSSVAWLKWTEVGPISRLTARAAAWIRASSARAAAKNTARLPAAVGAGSSVGRGARTYLPFNAQEMPDRASGGSGGNPAGAASITTSNPPKQPPLPRQTG